jgi:hypothetical protein
MHRIDLSNRWLVESGHDSWGQWIDLKDVKLVTFRTVLIRRFNHSPGLTAASSIVLAIQGLPDHTQLRINDWPFETGNVQPHRQEIVSTVGKFNSIRLEIDDHSQRLPIVFDGPIRVWLELD